MSKEVEPPKEVVESKQTNSKRKADVVDKEYSRKRRTGDKSKDSIEAVKEFIQDRDKIMLVLPIKKS